MGRSCLFHLVFWSFKIEMCFVSASCMVARFSYQKWVSAWQTKRAARICLMSRPFPTELVLFLPWGNAKEIRENDVTHGNFYPQCTKHAWDKVFLVYTFVTHPNLLTGQIHLQHFCITQEKKKSKTFTGTQLQLLGCSHQTQWIKRCEETALLI